MPGQLVYFKGGEPPRVPDGDEKAVGAHKLRIGVAEDGNKVWILLHSS